MGEKDGKNEWYKVIHGPKKKMDENHLDQIYIGLSKIRIWTKIFWTKTYWTKLATD